MAKKHLNSPDDRPNPKLVKKLTEALQNLLGVMQGIRSTNSLDCVKIGKWLFENKQHILPLEEFQTIAAEAIPVLIVGGWVSPGGVISDDVNMLTISWITTTNFSKAKKPLAHRHAIVTNTIHMVIPI